MEFFCFLLNKHAFRISRHSCVSLVRFIILGKRGPGADYSLLEAGAELVRRQGGVYYISVRRLWGLLRRR